MCVCVHEMFSFPFPQPTPFPFLCATTKRARRHTHDHTVMEKLYSLHEKRENDSSCAHGIIHGSPGESHFDHIIRSCLYKRIHMAVSKKSFVMGSFYVVPCPFLCYGIATARSNISTDVASNIVANIKYIVSVGEYM